MNSCFFADAARRESIKTSSKKTASAAHSSYGDLFEPVSGESSKERGKRYLNDALCILNKRLPGNDDLRKVPLPRKTADELFKLSFDFLRKHLSGPFERDNLNHVGRLVTSMKRYAKDLNRFLGIDARDVQLVAALHDLGKSRVVPEMYEFLETIFGEQDFINLRVLPHEFFSFYWTNELCRKLDLDAHATHTLIDLTANHNFGPDLNDPQLRLMLGVGTPAAAKHWWLSHWKAWADKATKGGLNVPAQYGHIVSPLACTLVLFDRVDGGHPHSWEKFLNQDFLSGQLEFSSSNIIRIFSDSNSSARDQIRAVGKQIQSAFQEKKLSVEDFSPYQDAIKMLEENVRLVGLIAEANSPQQFQRLNVPLTDNILYESRQGDWFRIEFVRGPKNFAYKYAWDGKAWKKIEESVNPVALLVETIYHDWNT